MEEKKVSVWGLKEIVKVCPECNGECEVKDNSGKFIMKKCPECDGRGWVK